MAMFPDSGVPPGDAKNSLPDVNTLGCGELWYSTSRCQPRFDPAAANAMLAEQMNLINKGEVAYNCNTLDNVQLATRYLMQRGLTHAAYAYGGPLLYTAAMDPTLTYYNNHLTMVIVPQQNNQGAVRINIDGKGEVWILRNDGQHLQSGDLRANVPSLISFWGGSFYHVGLCFSQVPLMANVVDIWIRTDGDDSTGDGSANTPDKAFKTVVGAWTKVGSRYAQTPLLTLNFRLGIPGTYIGGWIGPFGGTANVIGDVNNRTAYRFTCSDVGNNGCANFRTVDMSIKFSGVTFVRDWAAPWTCDGISAVRTAMVFDRCDFDNGVSNPSGNFLYAKGGEWGVMGQGAVYSFYGRGFPMRSIFVNNTGATGGNCYEISGARFEFRDCQCAHASFEADNLSVMGFNPSPQLSWTSTNCTGPMYRVNNNSVMNVNGHTPPGNAPGSVGAGGQYNA